MREMEHLCQDGRVVIALLDALEGAERESDARMQALLSAQEALTAAEGTILALMKARNELALQLQHPLGGFCSYCGHHFKWNSTVSEEARAQVVEHMVDCAEAPYSRMAVEILKLRPVVEAAREASNAMDGIRAVDCMERIRSALASLDAKEKDL
jgi:hypothetical protein